jgi:hypothetical protein
MDTRYNGHYLLSDITESLLRAIFHDKQRPRSRRVGVYLGDCRINRSKASDAFVNENNSVCMPHPVYSRDLALSHSWPFDYLMGALVR